MSNPLREKCSLTKLRKELERRKGKLCQYCKRFRHLARNCRNKKERKKGTIIPQNKFEVLRSRVMQCGVEERMIRRHEVVVVECFKCGEKGHKYRECPLWKERVEGRVVHVARPQKAHQQREPAYPEKGKAQEEERKLRRMEKEEAACMAKLQEAQQG